MSGLTLARVTERVRQLPSLSLVVHEILQSFANDNVDITTLVSKISHDQGLAARVLRVANSAFYGLSSHVASVGEAVVVLGFHSVRSLALAAGIINQFPPASVNTFDRLEFWRHAIGVAVCARVIATRVGYNGEVAFTAGLLHDIGRLVLDAYFHEDFEQVLAYRAAQDCEMVDAELQVLGVTHTTIGYEVAKQWKFPQGTQLAIRDHHRPNGEEKLTDVVHLANVLCHALEIGNSGYDMVPQLSADAWGRLGLSWAQVREMQEEIERINVSTNLLTNE